MIRTLRLLACAATLSALSAVPVLSQTPGAAKKDALLKAMTQELQRSFAALKAAEKPPLYFLAYEVTEEHGAEMSALLGALVSESENHSRRLDVTARIGNPKLDSTHQMKGMEGWWEGSDSEALNIATDDDEASLRADLWLHTDKAYRNARERYTKVETNKAVTAEEEDKSDDFSKEAPARSYDKAALPEFDREALRARLKRLSAAIKPYPFVINSQVSLSLEAANRYLVNSEGTEVVTGNRYLRLSYYMTGRTTDGMDLERYESYDAERLEDFPSEEKILADIARSAAELEALVKAPLVEPYAGPAIFKARAAGVYFHEILGHRLEGHRQKLEEEGQTFKKKLGEKVTADFLTIVDDATVSRYGDRFLRGSYRFDDEGVPSRPVNLIENGVLKGFLMSRSPIDGFPASNGHGRKSAGREVVARMGNTLVKASKTVTYPKLRDMLINEIRRQKKPYGLIFDDISGGFTMTGRSGVQAFKVLPLLVYRVYPDGRPDEIVRGVDIVGTPLMSFTKIAAAADDYGIFNGTCGAESGWVPVSAVSPSLLFSEIEVEKKLKFSEKPPVLPPPHHDPVSRNSQEGRP